MLLCWCEQNPDSAPVWNPRLVCTVCEMMYILMILLCFGLGDN